VAHRDPVCAYEREPFFRFQAHGLETGGPQSFCAWHPSPRVIRLAATDQDLPDLRHLGQVRLTHRATCPHYWMDSRIQSIEEHLYELGPYPDAALRHAIRPRDHHRPHDLGAQLSTLVRGVAGDQAYGELLQALEGDAVARERADTRVHAVHQVSALQYPIHDVPSPPYAPEGLA
jgi:hypothetical protein